MERISRRDFLKKAVLLPMALGLGSRQGVSAQEVVEVGEKIIVQGTEFRILPTVNNLGQMRIKEIAKVMNELIERGKIPLPSWKKVNIDGGEGGARTTSMTIYPVEPRNPLKLIVPDCYSKRVDVPEEDYQILNLAGAMASISIEAPLGTDEYDNKQASFANLIIQEIIKALSSE